MTLTHRLSATSLLLLAIAASGCQSMPLSTTSAPASPAPSASVAPGASPSPTASAQALPTAGLSGIASVAVVAVGGANVIAAGGANVIAAGGANVIAAGGANVIAAGGANVIAAGGANYRLAGLEPETELPVYGAIAYLRDPVTRQRLAWAPPVLTDAKGQFHFDHVPAGLDFLVEVDFVTADDHTPYRLLTLARAGQNATADARTTTVVAGLLPSTSAAGQSTGLYALDSAAQGDAVTALQTCLAGLPAVTRQTMLTKAIAMGPAEMVAARGNGVPSVVDPQALADLQQTLRAAGKTQEESTVLVIPDQLTDGAISAPASLCRDVAAVNPTFKQDIQMLQAAELAPLSSATQSLLSALSPTGTSAGASGSTGTSATVGTTSGGVNTSASTSLVGTSTSTGVTVGTSGTSVGTSATTSTGVLGGTTSTSTSTSTSGSTLSTSTGTSAGTSSTGTVSGTTSTSTSGTSTSTSTGVSTGTTSTGVSVTTGTSGTSTTVSTGTGTTVGVKI